MSPSSHPNKCVNMMLHSYLEVITAAEMLMTGKLDEDSWTSQDDK